MSGGKKRAARPSVSAAPAAAEASPSTTAPTEGDPVVAAELATPEEPATQRAATRKATKKPQHPRAGGYIDRGDGRGWVLEDA